MKRVRKLIPALDTDDLQKMEALVRSVDESPLIYGYKIGFIAGLTHGLGRVVQTIRRHSSKPIIYDHQKAATDIPDMGTKFAALVRPLWRLGLRLCRKRDVRSLWAAS